MEGNELPRLVYVSREKRPGYNHHKKAGAMNALVNLIMCFMPFLSIFYNYSNLCGGFINFFGLAVAGPSLCCTN